MGAYYSKMQEESIIQSQGIMAAHNKGDGLQRIDLGIWDSTSNTTITYEQGPAKHRQHLGESEGKTAHHSGGQNRNNTVQNKALGIRKFLTGKQLDTGKFLGTQQGTHNRKYIYAIPQIKVPQELEPQLVHKVGPGNIV